MCKMLSEKCWNDDSVSGNSIVFFLTNFKMCVLVSLGCHNKILKTGWLKQQKSIFSQF